MLHVTGVDCHFLMQLNTRAFHWGSASPLNGRRKTVLSESLHKPSAHPHYSALQEFSGDPAVNSGADTLLAPWVSPTDSLYKSKWWLFPLVDPYQPSSLTSPYDYAESKIIRFYFDRFLHELAQIPNFAERAQCIIFRAVFSEGVTALHRKVEIVTRASKVCLGLFGGGEEDPMLVS